jgi:hypothetical protein
MDNYILDRLRLDASHFLARAEQESSLPHDGMMGRFRELLIDNILTPWLPPYVSCGTGMIIEANNKHRRFTQDDIIVYDKSLTPPIMAAGNHTTDGVFLFNSVLERIEVKSNLTKDDIRNFVAASNDLSRMEFTVQEILKEGLEGAHNLLFAYNTLSKGTGAKGKGDVNYQLRRVTEVMKEQGIDPLSGKVSMVCIPPFGFWKIGNVNGAKCWLRLVINDGPSNVAWFVGCTSNSCYLTHAQRLGRDPKKGLEGGIGMYIPGDVYEPVPGPF